MVNPIHHSPAQYGDSSLITPQQFANAIRYAEVSLENKNLQAAQTALTTIYQYVSPGGGGGYNIWRAYLIPFLI
jgi:hypothetical protein